MKLGIIHSVEAKMTWFVKVLFVLFTLHASLITSTAQVSVEANIDQIEMLVGEQAHVTLKAVTKKESKVEFPQFQYTQQITPGIDGLHLDIVRRYLILSSVVDCEGRR